MNQFTPDIAATGHPTACIGLISDTHMPERCPELPPALFNAFDGVDLILHAGDVGELWVLDQLSQMAPVVAVHGNDETPAAQRELPYQQVVTCAGQRILLWHSHFPNRIDEMAARGGDELRPKLVRSVERAKRAGAGVVVFGHWHIPLVDHQEGVLVINPGALASGNSFTRQLHQTVALLFLYADHAPQVVHVDLAAPDQLFPLSTDWDAGFQAAAVHFNASILAADLEADLPRLRDVFLEQVPEAHQTAVFHAINCAAQPCWSGAAETVTRAEWCQAIQNAPDIPAAVKTSLLSLLALRSI